MPTPYLLRPLDHGADVVVHSLTKFLGGHGTSMGGVVVDGGRFDWAASGRFPGLVEPDASYHGLKFYVETFGPLAYALKLRVTLLRDIGAAISPFNAFLITQGIETLPLRMERHSSNAQAVAEFLDAHDKVGWVTYPACARPLLRDRREYHHRLLYGAMIGFGIKGGREAGRRFVEGTRLLSHLANIGDAKSLCIHPATTTHSQLTPDEQVAAGVTDDFVRLSIGLETVDDIFADIDQAMGGT